jgi:SAM-dependent methyltransferase
MTNTTETYDGNINPWILSKILEFPKKNLQILDVWCWKWQLWKEILKVRTDCAFSGIEKYAPKSHALQAWYTQVYDIDLHRPESLSQIQYKYDIIICWDVLEHTLEPEKVLHELQLLLSVDGVILVSLPNICFIQNRITHFLWSWNYAPPGTGGIMDSTHYRFFSLSSMKELFIESGLQIVQYRGLGFIRSFLRVLNPLVYLWPNMWAMQIVFLLKK